ncbi:MAG: CRISPR system precrRNA processing endoribonuclease RAMP protein Cas6 [Chloroflexi bacterium]|nr:CRISPR system precrRNA processing endoribonuclease RAMP protein Cas6 [Chloroflexota bacterium]
MFLSVILPLTALNTPAPEANHFFGREAHALFLNLVQNADPLLAAALHEPRGDKPFTVSGLTPVKRGAGMIRAGQTYEWRITSFEPRLSALLSHQVLPHLLPQVRLGAAQFQVGAPLTEQQQHPWAGASDARALVRKWFDETPRVEKRITLQFASPTAYRHIHRNILVPNPEALWAGYLAAWNAHSAPRFEDDLIAQVAQNVALTRYALNTERADFAEYRETGWVGTGTFTIFSGEIALCRVLHLLADFAFYCGTGYKTTQGMGQTRRLEQKT